MTPLANALDPGSQDPILQAASRGVLPPWAKAREGRREHMSRVASLLEGWAHVRREPPAEVARWIAAGHLHDALRDASEEELRAGVGEEHRTLPAKVLHGPAAAARLRADGVADEEVLHAIAFHTLGSPGFGTVGLALFAADFLEPGRKLEDEWRAELRRRAPMELEDVVKEILQARIRHLVNRGRPLMKETVAFWNRFAEGQGWASASEL